MVGMQSSAQEILDGLDDAQRRAATSVEGPVRIIACAGAGKTRTITRRIAYACASGAWRPGAALAVTFSVKAANEMRERLAALGVDGVRVATFHSAALAQLREVWNELCEGPFPQVA
ncbi:MAG: UvrD-helicase domain-containing protein, partial [Bifidobacterium castoris]|nr:UvrD-helicase domain-containing protein [Bifidobacterium castoris]